MVLDAEKLSLFGEGGLMELLSTLPETRQRRGIRHKVPVVLATSLCAVLAGARNFAAISEGAAELPKETLKRLGSRFGRPPSERTYRRVLATLEEEEVDRRTGGWLAEQLRLQPGVGLALDGTTARGSGDGDKPALHLLSAVVHGSSAVVAQTAVDSKTNEITKVGPLLSSLNIQGTVVTADALLTQRETARHLAEDERADYVFTAKDNQPTLRQDISSLFAAQEEEAKRLHRARHEPPETEAFPPSAQDRRQRPRPD